MVTPVLSQARADSANGRTPEVTVRGAFAGNRWPCTLILGAIEASRHKTRFVTPNATGCARMTSKQTDTVFLGSSVPLVPMASVPCMADGARIQVEPSVRSGAEQPQCGAGKGVL